MENHVGRLLLNRMKEADEKVMMRIKRNDVWEDFTGKKSYELLEKVAHSLLLENVKHQDNIGIFSQNMPEWTLADIGSLIIGAVPIPIYATSVSNQAKYILKDANIKVLFVGEQEQYDEILKVVDDEDLSIKRIVVLDKQVKLSHKKAIHFSDWILQNHDEVEDEYIKRKEHFSSEDLATIIYTSGTTGEPKGVMLSHENIIASCKNHDIKYHLSSDDDSLAFLPLSHVFERAWTYYVFHKGMCNTYLLDPKDVAEALLEVQPTVFCSVPRLYEKIYDMVYNKLLTASAVKRKLFHWSIRKGDFYEKCQLNDEKMSLIAKFKFKIADKLVLSKIRQKLGGNLKFMPCGGAFLSNEVTQFFRAAGLPVVIGYGLTETTATVTSYDIQKYSLGTVGEIMPNVEVKIGENDEILVKGKSVMKGYYNKPEETARVFDGDWFKTGDAGKFDENGGLIITDRIKDLMKTSGGKYIAPQQVESVLKRHNLIEQAIVIGEGKPYVTALLTPNFEALSDWAKKKDLLFENFNDLVNKSQIIEKYQSILSEIQTSLSQFEKVKNFTLMAKEFTIEHGEMTPTFKLKRKIITKKYEDLIKQMYKRIQLEK